MSLIGKIKAALDMQGNKIQNLAAPTAANDAATKDYVDNGGGGGAVTYGETFLQTTINPTLAADIQTMGDIKLFDVLIPANSLNEANEIIVDFQFYVYGSAGVLENGISLTNDGNTSAVYINPYVQGGDLYADLLKANTHLDKIRTRLFRHLDKIFYDKDTADPAYWTARPMTYSYNGSYDLGLTLDFTKDIIVSMYIQTAEADSKVIVLGGIKATLIG